MCLLRISTDSIDNVSLQAMFKKSGDILFCKVVVTLAEPMICWIESVLKDVSNFYLFWMWDNTLSLIWLNLGCFISMSVYPCIHLHSFLVFEGGKASTFKIFYFSQTEVKYLIEVLLLWKYCYELLIYLRL